MGVFSTTQKVMWPERATVNSSSSVPAQLSMTGADRPVAGGARRRPVPPPVLVPEPVVAGGGTGGGTSAAKGAPVPLAGGETVGLVVARPDDEESVGAGPDVPVRPADLAGPVEHAAAGRAPRRPGGRPRLSTAARRRRTRSYP